MSGLFDRLRQDLDKGVVQIGARSKQLVETTQLRSQLRLFARQKEQALGELGAMVYEMLKQDNFDRTRIDGQYELLQRLDAQMVDIEEKIRQAQLEAEKAIHEARGPAFARCDRCQAALQETSKFCPNCGNDVRAIVERVQSSQQVD